VRKRAEPELKKTTFRSALRERHAPGRGERLHMPGKLALKGKLAKVE